MSRAAASKRRAAHHKAQRRKKQESELAKLEGGSRYKLFDPGGGRKRRRIKSLKKKLGTSTKPKSNQTAKDKDDARKESELASVLDNKPKGGYKDTSPKPEPKKKEALKPTKGKGPVASGEEYGEHLKEQQKKYKTTGKGPVASGKEYGKTLKEHAAKKEADEKAAWLKKTRNSPAAKSRTNKGKPTFSDDERWALQKRHRAWKASRKKKK